MTVIQPAGAILTKTEAELVITRLFDAPRDLVFAAWTDPAHALAWWGPRDHPATHLAMDVRTGGAWSATLRAVETGKELRHGGVFREITPPERLAFTFAWEEEGERGLDTLVTLTFTDEGGKTRMTLRQAPFVSISERDGHGSGWSSCIDRLADYIAEERAH